MESPMNAVRYEATEVADRYERMNEAVPLRPIRDTRDYENAVTVMNRLLDQGGADESNVLADIVETLGTLIESYESSHVAVPEATGAEALRFLMAQNNLKQADLPEVATQGVISEILSGKRELTARQIVALRDRFQVAADVFL